MKKCIYLIPVFIIFTTNAQQIQWASKLIKFSSDLGGKQNGIKRILGKPDAFPQGGSSANAWSPKNALDGREVVVVGFEKPQTVMQIAVFENLNAGCVNRMFVSTDGEKFETVWSRKPDYKTPRYKTTLNTDRAYYFKRKRRKVQEVPDVFNPGIEYAILENGISGVVAVKVEFSFALLPGQKQIDAIGISDSDIPIEAKINSSPEFENLSKPESLVLNAIEPSAPIVSIDGNKIYFTNNSSEKEEIFSCFKTNNKWSTPVLESELSKNSNYNYLEFLNNEYLLQGGMPYNRGTNESGFCILKNNNGNYDNLGQLKIAAFNNYDQSVDASMTSDLKTMILSIETDFTQGGTDLYFSNKKEDETYGLLQNMGKSINSANDESTPQLLSDNKTMLFASNGFSGFGDYDLYVSYRLDDSWKNWSEPINLGSKINGLEFEGSPYYDEKNETLYFIKVIEGKSILSFIAIPKSILMKV